jgi:hypothetical protein
VSPVRTITRGRWGFTPVIRDAALPFLSDLVQYHVLIVECSVST